MSVLALADPAATDAFGARLAHALHTFDGGLVVALAGELGAGKTALTRAVLRALGHAGTVASPSYTLVEAYPLSVRTFYHLDLYRLADPAELEFLGVREIDTARDWLFVEWAERGRGFLPELDVNLSLTYAATGRSARLKAHSGRGRAFLAVLAKPNPL